MITDSNSGAGVIVDILHHKLHEGNLFAGCATATIGANTTAYFIFRPDEDGKFEYAVHSTAAFKSTLFEAPTLSTNTGETSFTMVNRNRNSSKTTTSVYATTPTANVSAVGTRLATVIVGGAFGIGSSVSDFNWGIDGTKTYALQVMNAGGAATNDVSVSINNYGKGAD